MAAGKASPATATPIDRSIPAENSPGGRAWHFPAGPHDRLPAQHPDFRAENVDDLLDAVINDELLDKLVQGLTRP